MRLPSEMRLGRFARFDFNGLGDLHGGFRNFRDSRRHEPAEPVVVRGCHSARNACGRLNELCLIHSGVSDRGLWLESTRASYIGVAFLKAVVSKNSRKVGWTGGDLR